MAEFYPIGGGGSPAFSSDTTAKPENVLAGYTAIVSNSNDEAVAGTLPATSVDWRYGGATRYNSTINF